MTMAGKPEDSAKAVIEDGAIVTHVPLENLQAVMDGGFACNAYDRRYTVTDTAGFGKEIADELDREDEEGTTPIHRLFDAAINAAVNSGAQHVEEYPEQEI